MRSWVLAALVAIPFQATAQGVVQDARDTKETRATEVTEYAEPAVADTGLGVTADATFASKYMIDGFNVGGENPVFQPSLAKQLFTPGLSLMFWSSLQINRDNSQWDELDLMARYGRTFLPQSRLAFHLHGYVDSYYFPKPNDVEIDGLGNQVRVHHRRGNKLLAGISFPYLLPVPVVGSYLVPSYRAGYWISWAQNRRDRYNGGAKHEAALDYYRGLPLFIPGATYQSVGLSGTINYHEGVFGVSPGWSHATAQASTSVYALGVLFGLSVNQQWSFEPTVNPQDELWTTLSFTKEF